MKTFPVSHPLPGAIPAARPAAPPTPAPWGADGVQLGSAPAPGISAAEAARAPGLSAAEAARIMDGPGLEKDRVPYRLRDFAASPDGSLYLLYSESPGKGRGYLARLDAGGRIAWERPLEKGSWRRLGALPDGGVRVGTPRGAVVVDAAGALRRTEESPMDAEAEFTDRAGVRYELRADRHVRAVDAEGRELALPEPLAKAFLEGGAPLADGGVLLRGGRHVFELAPGGALRRDHELPDWPRYGSTKCAVVDAWPLPDGGLLVQRRDSTEVPGQYEDYNPGGHMGPLMDPIPVTTHQHRLVRLEGGGKVLWESDPLGAMPRLCVLPDGTAFLDRPNPGAAKAPLGRVRPEDGKLEQVHPVAGSIQELRAEPSGTVLLGQGDTWTRLDGAGRPVAEASLPAEHRGSRLAGLLPDGRLLFRDPDDRQAWACRLETGEWTPLTDPVADHSLVLKARELPPEGPPPEVVDGQDWVIIGDVRLPRKG